MFQVDENDWKWDYSSINKRKYKIYSCKCTLCEKCWYREDADVCIYGGPFTGWEKDNG